MTDKEAIAVVTIVCVLFALQHSLLVTDWAKERARRLFGETFVRAYYRLGFTLISTMATVLAAYVYVSLPDETLWIPPWWVKVLMYLGQAAAMIFAVRSLNTVRFGEFSGLAQAWRHLRHGQVGGDVEGIGMTGLVKAGSYRYVRHPLYLAGILIITLSPEFTRNHIVLVMCGDAYFIAGALIEERRLIAHFGDEYRTYMKEVPRFIPSLRRYIKPHTL